MIVLGVFVLLGFFDFLAFTRAGVLWFGMLGLGLGHLQTAQSD